jgi:hypothetical protein
MWEHNEGIDTKAYTFARRPVRLVYVAEFSEVMQAIVWEKTIKRWRRKKKGALIAGDGKSYPHWHVGRVEDGWTRSLSWFDGLTMTTSRAAPNRLYVSP